MTNEINTSDGYICLYRKFLKWEWYDDANTMRVFLHCLLSANHKTNKWRGIVVQQGSFITSIGKLANRLKLSVKQVRTSLDKLKRTGEVASEGTSQYTMITVKNWVEYQEKGEQKGERRANEGQTKGKRRATNNNDNNDNNENNEKIATPFFYDLSNPNIEKYFEIYRNICINLLPLKYERRNRKIRELILDLMQETDSDLDYFKDVCTKANKLKVICNNKLDFKGVIKNHISIDNEKFKQEVTETEFDYG